MLENEERKSGLHLYFFNLKPGLHPVEHINLYKPHVQKYKSLAGAYASRTRAGLDLTNV